MVKSDLCTLFNNNTPHSDQKVNYLVGTPVYAQNRAKSVGLFVDLISCALISVVSI